MNRADCWYCGTSLAPTGNTPNRRTVDHQTPRSRGGFSTTDNMVESCAKCNFEKGGMTVDEYRLIIAYRRGLLKHSGAEAAARQVKFWGENK